MASAAEQLALHFRLSSFFRAKELQKRLWFTIVALLIYRLGTHIPLPGIEPAAYAAAFRGQSGGILGLFNMFSGGAVERMAIFTLGIMPYISASIIVQLMTSIVPTLEGLKKEGEQGRRIINQYTRYGTVLLATLQAYGVAVGLEGGQGLVIDPGWFFRASTVISLLGGTMFLMWLGEQITARGIGNGISLIIFAGIAAGLPSALIGTAELHRTSALSTQSVLIVIVAAVAVIALIVLVERAQRRIAIQYPKRQSGPRAGQGRGSHLPLKLNTAGVIPAIFASSLLMLPATLAGFAGNAAAMPTWATMAVTALAHGQPVFMLCYGCLIAFFAFFYTAIVFSPKDTADNLKRHGGFIPGVRPGDRTAEYINHVLTRITVVGAAYLVVVCLLPEFLIAQSGVPLALGGTSLLIAVSVTLDTATQVQGHLIAHRYEGMILETKLRRRRPANECAKIDNRWDDKMDKSAK